MKRLLSFFAIVVLLGAQSLQAQWIQTNGPNGGTVTCFAVNGSNLFAGTFGGVFLSTNNGISWVNTGLTDSQINALAVSGSNLFAGTSRGVFLSTNNGTSWTAVNTGLIGAPVWSLAVSGSNLFAGTLYGGVFLSTNNGTSWTAVNTGLPNVFVWSLAVSGSFLFAGTSDGVFLFTNSGTSWTKVSIGLPTNTYVWSLAVSGSILFAGTSDGVFRSTNNGTSWTAASTGLPSIIDVYALAVSGTNLFAGIRSEIDGTFSDSVFLSTNNGTSWTAASTGLTNTYVRSLAVNGSNLFAGTGGRGVWRRPLSEMVTAVKDDFNQVPVGFKLEQNYPNPFNPETTIRYQLAKASSVRLQIYNLHGQMVRTLVDAKMKAGEAATIWDGKDEAGDGVPSGAYFYRLQVNGGEWTSTRKMMVIR